MKILSDLVYFYTNKRIHNETDEIPIERWNRTIKEKRTKLRNFKSYTDLDAIFSLHFKRRVANDGSFRFQSRVHKLRQYVAFIPDKKIMALKNGQKIWQYHLDGINNFFLAKL